MKKEDVTLKVAEAIQDDVEKGIVRIDSAFMKDLEVNPGDVIEIEGERKTSAIVDRSYPGDIGLDIIRMDGLIRRNAKTGLGETVKIRKIDVREAKKVTIAPAKKGIVVRASPVTFKRGLLGRSVVKGDIVSLGGVRRRKNAMSDNPFFNEIFSMQEEKFGNFFADLKFIVVATDSKTPVIIGENTEVTINPESVEISDETVPDVSYEDIGGLDDELKKVREMVELPLKHPEVFERLGIEPPKGVLMHGPPGTGKTLLAKAVANETNAHFILINGPEIMSKFYGESEANLRKKFEEAEKNAPSIVFIDEIDAIASKREETHGEVEKRVVAQLLAIMDGLQSRGKVIVIAASNIPHALDPALRRPGRFDRELEIGVPGKDARLQILKIHTRNMPLKGSLYAENIKPLVLDEIDVKIKNINLQTISKEEMLNQKEDKLKGLNNELENSKKQINDLQKQISSLDIEKETSDQSMIYKILDSIKRLTNQKSSLEKEVQNFKESIDEQEKEISKIKSEIEDFKSGIIKIENVLVELKEDKSKINDLTNEIIDLEVSVRNRSLSDPRGLISQNKISELYPVLMSHNIVSLILDKASQKGIVKDLESISEITHGFVGADVSALAKEAAMTVLREVFPDIQNKEEDEAIPRDVLEKLFITKQDFYNALKVVRPSAMREVLVEVPSVKWEDVGGLEDARQELLEAIEWPLKNPEAFKRLGISPPKGVLLYGPPGTGKTLLAKAVATETQANFISIKGPELLSKWVGESEKAIREIFKKARQTSPTVIFFDEIDSIAPGRNQSSESSVTQRVVNQLLTELDGLEELHNVVVIAATNRPDIMDAALLRPGRFDRILLTPVPDKKARLKIFEVHTKEMPLKDVNLDILADKTDGYVGADIEAICREAAIIALRKSMDAKEVTFEHFEKALEKVHASVNKDIQDSYENLEKNFRMKKAKEINESVNYMG